MKKNASRKLLFVTISIVVLTLLSAVAINLFTAKKEVTGWLEKVELNYLIAGIVFAGIVLIFLAYLKFRFAEKAEEETLAGDIEPDVKKFYDSLRERYQKRYESKLDERFEITLEVSEDWDGHKTQTFNERYHKDAKISKAFPRIQELFDTKDGLLIVGEPGAGKTVLLLKVALNLLENTNLTAKEAFPVIFNLASWNDEYEDFGEWLKAMLVSGNGLSKDFASRLLQEKRLILLLDGLDELARNEEKAEADKKRAACLKALNEYLDGEKTVICCRIDEFVALEKNEKQDAPVSAKVEVLPLTEAEVLNALEVARNDADTKHHVSAGNLIELFLKEENTALGKVLCTPFYFTIALEVFYRHIPEEINLPIEEEKLKTYLIEKYVERKVTKTPNTGNFDNGKTKKWLNWLAKLMEDSQIVTFELAELQPIDLKRKWLYKLLIFIAIFITTPNYYINLLLLIFKAANKNSTYNSFFSILKTKVTHFEAWSLIIRTMKLSFFLGLLFGFFARFISGYNLPARGGFVLAFLIGFFTELHSSSINTEDINKWKMSIRFRHFNFFEGLKFSFDFAVLLGLFAALPLGLSFILFPDNSPNKIELFIVSVSVGFLMIAIIGFLLAFFANFVESFHVIVSFASLEKPYQRLVSGVRANILFAVIFSIIPALVLFNGIDHPRSEIDLTISLTFFLVYVVILGSIVGFILTPLFKHLVLRSCLYLEGTMPLQYVTFLDYMADARILEKDGGRWRFRHQNLQEYFANLDK